MKTLILAAVIGLGIGNAVAAVTQQSAQLYSATPVITQEDARNCGKSGGNGALVFGLDETGNPVSDLGAFCLISVK